MNTALDPRRNAYRADLADARLRGRAPAAVYVEGRPARCVDPVAPYKPTRDAASATTATLILGEPVLIFEEIDGWAWAQSERDGYVGYVRAEAFGAPGPNPSHRVRVPRTHLYPEPDFKAPPLGWAPMGGLTALTGRRSGGPHGERFAETADGVWMVLAHLSDVRTPETDWTAAAARFLGTPYLWGGESAEGIDCSGLVQIALEQTGRACPRDSDMQAAELGSPLPPEAPLRRGDFLFWKGHVGLMLDPDMLLHANAGAMACSAEPLEQAIRRIEAGGDGPVTGRRRLLDRENH